MTPPDAPLTLASLRGLRHAPSLDGPQRQHLRRELLEALARCQWFTLGVMAPDRANAVACLRACERTLGWSPLLEEGSGEGGEETGSSEEGPVFLKGNQRSGTFRLRVEAGLGEGLLITGHNPDDPQAEDTWGPLPLDLLA